MRKRSIHKTFTITIFAFLMGNIFLAHGQNQAAIDSLTQLLNSTNNDHKKTQLHNNLAYEYRHYDSLKTTQHIEVAIQLAKNLELHHELARSHDILGWLAIRNRSFQTAKNLFLQALEFAEQANTPRNIANAYNGLGATYWYLLKPDAALDFYSKSLKIRKEIGDFSGVVAIYNNMANVLKEKKSYREALAIYEKALDLQQTLPENLRVTAGLFLNSALVYRRIGQQKKALDRALHSFELYTQLNDLNNIDYAAYSIGGIYRRMGHHPKSLEYYLKSLKIREESNNLIKLSSVHNAIGILFYEQKEYEEALFHYYQFLSVNKTLNRTRPISTAYNNIALVHEHLNNLDSAEYYYLQCIEMDKEHIHEKILGWAYNGMAIIRQDQLRLEEAEEWVLKAIDIRMANRNEHLAQSYNTLGKNYLLQNQYSKALEYYQSSAAICESLGNLINYQDALEGLSICYEKTGNIQEALIAHKLFKSISDSLFNVNSTKDLTQQSMQYQFDKEKHKIELANQKHSLLQDQKLANQTYITYAILICCTIAIVVAFIIYRNFRHKKKAHRLLSRQHEEIIQQREEIRSQAEEIMGQNSLLTKQKETLERSYEDLQLLNTIGKDITQNLSMATVISIVHEKIKTLMDTTEFGIGIYDEENETITFKNYFSHDQVMPAVVISTQDSSRLSTYCLNYNQEIWLNDIKRHYHHYIDTLESYEHDELLNSIICLPLISGKHKIGILSVQSSQLNAYSQYHVSLLRNIATYTAVAIENAKAYEKILELDQFKESMTGMIVHDLKNPLNAIIGLSADKLNAHTQQSIYQSGRQMLNLVSNILDVYKFESTKMTLNPQDYDVGEVIFSAWEQVRFLSQNKNIQFVDQINTNLSIKVDFEIIERVIVNLLTNAIKYTPYAGTITISSKLVEGDICISIADTGQGIPSDKIDLIFDKFGQAEARKSGQARSTGLGLTFCKMAVEAHNGTISVTSAENQGSTFSMTLPQGTMNPANASSNGIIQQTNDELLDANELDLISPYLADLKQLKVYEASKLNRILQHIEAQPNSKLDTWKNKLKQAAFNTNMDEFTRLIDSVQLKEKALKT